MNQWELVVWYRGLDTIQRKAVDYFNATGDYRMVRFFWHTLPGCAEQPMPAHLEWLWWVWYGSLSRVDQVAINAYFNVQVRDARLLLFVWERLLYHAQQGAEVPAA